MGVFEPTRYNEPALKAASEAGSAGPGDRELAGLLRERRFGDFLRRAVRLRRNILLSGATGSGKTTLSKALILEVPPRTG